jgi:YhcH/YjgK/YiaL family protein
MIIDSLTGFERYFSLNPHFEKVFNFLRSRSLDELEEGRYEIDGSNAYAMVSVAKTRKVGDALLETHDSYIDIQMPLEGYEIIGWRDRSRCAEVSAAYDEAGDITFYDDEPDALVNLAAMCIAVIFPYDAHAPLIGNGKSRIKKVVVKVKINPPKGDF